MSYYGSEEAFRVMEDTFSEKSVRLGFLRKVFGILTVQLLITVGFISIFMFVEEVNLYARQNQWMFWVAFVMTIVFMLAMACSQNIRRKFPMNLVVLFIFTLLEAFLLGTITSMYQTESVMIAIGICAVVSFGLVLFALQTKVDFTACGGFLLVALLVLMCFGLFAIIFPSKVMIMLYSSIGALIFALYLVFDVQIMMGGNHRYTISPEEYVYGALNLYLDIVNLFLMILNITQGSRS